LKLKKIRGNKIRKFYWNKKIFNVKILALLPQNIIRKKSVPNIIRKTIRSKKIFKEECDVNIIIINSVCICDRVIWIDMRLNSSMELTIV